MFCPKCGSFTEGSDRFCPTCGCNLDEEGEVGKFIPIAPPEDPVDNPHPAKRSKKVFVAIVAGCIVLAGALGFVGGFFYAKSSLPSYFGFVFVNEKAFPDEALRSYVSEYIDIDNNGIITPNENAAVTQFDITNLAQTTYQMQPLKTDENNAASYAVVGSPVNDEENSDPDARIPESLVGIEQFSNLQSLVCTNMGLTELNLSAMPSLKYVDCRGNDFGVLDLSNNSKIESLFCDDDVYLTGTDKAGLYCDDLLVQASATSGDMLEPVEMTLTYDAYGRMVIGYGKTYFYDEQGRLSGVLVQKSQPDGTIEPAFVDQYVYDENGSSMKSIRHDITYDNANNPETYAYEAELSFDELGKLVSEQTTVPTRFGYNLMNVRELNYAHSDETGLVTQSTWRDSSAGLDADKMTYDTQGTTSYSYSGSQLASRTSSSAITKEGANESQTSRSTVFTREGTRIAISKEDASGTSGFLNGETTFYDDRGFPTETLFGNAASTSATITYECNIDGYITKASWNFGENAKSLGLSQSNRVLTMSYVKHVGGASCQKLLPYLPTYVYTSLQDYDTVDMRWQPSNGIWFVASLVETDPVIKAKEREGLFASSVRSGMRLLDEGSPECLWPWRVNVLWIPTATDIPDEAYNRVSSKTTSDSNKTVVTKSTLGDYSWDDLSIIAEKVKTCSTQADAMALAKSYNLVDSSGALTGNSIPVTMADGTTLDIELVGIFHDDKADGSGKAGLTFMTSNAYANYPMNTSATNAGGWEASDMRDWLNTTVLDRMPDDLQSLVMPVVKPTNNVGRTESADSVSTTEDRIWLFSQTELYGTITWNQGYDTYYIDDVLNVEGTQYQLFREAGIEGIATTDKKGILKKYVTENGKSELSNWWVRSPTPNREDGFGDVDNGAPDNGGTATASQGVVFGFCL